MVCLNGMDNNLNLSVDFNSAHKTVKGSPNGQVTVDSGLRVTSDATNNQQRKHHSIQKAAKAVSNLNLTG